MKRQRTRKGAPGIVEVAQRAGVSPATVSRFFNSPDIVRGPTRKRIEKAAADLGYIRDRMAGTLHNRFSGTIGLVVPTIDNAIFSELIEAFAARLREHDRTMLIASHGYNLSLEVEIVRSLLERRIDGVALIGFDHEAVPLEMLALRNVPVLAIWNFDKNSNITCVGSDNFDAGFQVTKYLMDHGHKDIALLFPETKFNDRARDRLNGALSALGKSEGQMPLNRILATSYDLGDAKNTAVELLQSDPPTALVCGNDVIAQGATFACQKLGLQIPQDMSIIGIGDFRGSAHMEPALTTLRLPAKQIGEISADKLCQEFPSTHGGTPERILVPTRLIERASVSHPRNRRRL